MAKPAQQAIFNFTQRSLSKIAEVGVDVKVLLPDGTDTGAVIKVRGDQSPAVRAYGRQLFQEYQMKNKAAKSRGRDPEDMSLEEAEEMAVTAAVIRTISWSGIGGDNGEIPFSEAAAKKLYTDEPWIKDLVMEAAADAFRFCGK
jgi:hypothetical protein